MNTLIRKVGTVFCLVLVVAVFSGCDPDRRLRGTWDGNEYQEGSVIGLNDRWEFSSDEAIFRFTINRQRISVFGRYSTDRMKNPHHIDITFTEVEADGVRRPADPALRLKGVYTFKGRGSGRELYLAVYDDFRPPERWLDKEVGPVFVGNKTGKSLIDLPWSEMIEDSMSKMLGAWGSPGPK